MKNRPYFSGLLLLIFISTSQFASGILFVEDFSIPRESGWSGGGGAATGFIGSTDENGSLEFVVGDFGTFFLLANAASSDGQFSGDLLSRGVTGFSFDLFISPESIVTELRLELGLFAVPDHRWSYSFGTPTIGEVVKYSLSIENSSGWIQVSGDNAFETVISNVYEFMILLEGSPSFDASASGYLDNVAVIPEPSVVHFLLFALAIVLARNVNHANNAIHRTLTRVTLHAGSLSLAGHGSRHG
jgi:hypothetical protein